ncbi:hypothetical protein NDU88_004705 [Pleurodeles waltl]|uniref:Uncharacterized protein n=1 Tax=Pleurodeles waltl TaxID=8319 RepID=A0AAV7SJJ5_PLEWA|nr:hypothetical protein NDU88_004705 [Pleurodeles waltl]
MRSAVSRQQALRRVLPGPLPHRSSLQHQTRMGCERLPRSARQRTPEPSPDLASEMAGAAWTLLTHGRAPPVPRAHVRCHGCKTHTIPLLVEGGQTNSSLCREIAHLYSGCVDRSIGLPPFYFLCSCSSPV